MKRLVLTATALVLAAGAASAMTYQPTLTTSDKMEIRQFVPNADFSHLTPAQVLELQAVLYSSDPDTAGQLRSILG